MLNVLIEMRNVPRLGDTTEGTVLIPDSRMLDSLQELEHVPVILVLVVGKDAALLGGVDTIAAMGAAIAINHSEVGTNLALTDAEINHVGIGDVVPK